jgi:predicted dehydrogenase
VNGREARQETEPVRVAIFGMGGFAGAHHRAVHELERQGVCTLVATCDPRPDRHAALVERVSLATRGVHVYDNHLSLLERDGDNLEVVTLPTPLPLHAEMHADCARRGLAIYLEKPPTLDYTELGRMLGVEQGVQKLTNVGFNYISDPLRRSLKQRLMSDEFGAVRRVCFCGLWPRPASYYARTFWAGKLLRGGRLVLDSCMGNAMSHYVHNVLHWAGHEGMDHWAEVSEVSAELYRAHDIESFDTAFVKATTTDGVELLLALSHACAGAESEREWVICEKATIHQDTRTRWHIARADRSEPEILERASMGLRGNLAAYLAYVRGRTARPFTMLSDSRPFVELCDLALVAAQRIRQIPEEVTQHISEPEEGCVAIRGLGDVVNRFFADGLYPSQQGVIWGSAGGMATPADLPRLRSVAQAMSCTNR